MKITSSLSEESRTLYGENLRGHGRSYMGSKFLADAFVKRGHDLTIIHPSDLIESKKGIIARRTYTFQEENFFIIGEDQKLSGDVFFVYSLDEEKGPLVSKQFLDRLYVIENQFDLMLNSAESTSYEYKPKQKSLDLPWIPEFEVKKQSDISDLLVNGEKIIAKPKIGACGQGIVFLEDGDNINQIKELENFFFEKYIPAVEERRYIFLDEQCIIRRRIKKTGLPGKEKCTNIDLMEGDERELAIAKKTISSIGMFYGTVDFRGDYVLEINGSGTGVAPPTVGKERDCYNLSNPIVQAVERKIQKQ